MICRKQNSSRFMCSVFSVQWYICSIFLQLCVCFTWVEKALLQILNLWDRVLQVRLWYHSIYIFRNSLIRFRLWQNSLMCCRNHLLQQKKYLRLWIWFQKFRMNQMQLNLMRFVVKSNLKMYGLHTNQVNGY